MKFATKTIHGGQKPDPSTGAIMPPIYQTSTYVQSAPGEHQGYEYSRSQNPTRDALQKNLAALENGQHGLCFASGLAAIDAVIKLLQPGDEVISSDDLYGGSYRLFKKIFEPLGIKFHFVAMQNISKVEEMINPNTKMIWVETPTNPMMNIIDLKVMGQLARKNGLLMAVDNTFATPFLQQPLKYHADIVVHSATKYLGGHSDVIMGAVVVNDDDLAERLAFIQNACGAVPGPQDCFLVLRGIKTLALRMERHCDNGKQVAQFLKQHPRVDKVYWPGFQEHPNHAVANAQMRDYGGMISFSLKDNTQEAATKVLQQFRFFALAESLGGVESLAGHPASMTHASIPEEQREKVGIVNSLIRLSVGIEDIEDLLDDLDSALK
ncbi:cystathionine gamma-synthase [Persicobacter psychrovividus]|uniref:Cystathionine beta-lyase n=1 Tax=Persicobacter psychrovividus TaxID=387638 RepID=A0ABM7VHF1_9BACT|nr:cystathionine beta-lyase [Persicobacter psychrovividus]